MTIDLHWLTVIYMPIHDFWLQILCCHRRSITFNKNMHKMQQLQWLSIKQWMVHYMRNTATCLYCVQTHKRRKGLAVRDYSMYGQRDRTWPDWGHWCLQHCLLCSSARSLLPGHNGGIGGCAGGGTIIPSPPPDRRQCASSERGYNYKVIIDCL